MTDKSLIKLPADAMGTLQAFLPDTPWTTPTLHVIDQRHGAAYVDSPESPRNLVIVAKGNGKRTTPDQAFLFGVPTAHGIREFVSSVQFPTEFICDEDMTPVVKEFHPDAKLQEYIVCWYDYLEVEVPESDVRARRLRMADSPQLEQLLPSWANRTFPTTKNLIMGGAVYGVFEEDDLVSAAFTLDHSTKFERVAAVTHETYRRKGYAHAAMAKLINGCPDRGRIPCCVVPRDNLAAWGLAAKLEFPHKAVMRSLIRG